MGNEIQNDKKINDFLGTRKILIVDPDSTSRISVQRMLAGLGVKNKDIFMAWNYEDAVSQLRSVRPEIVLSDYTLGQNSGVELLNIHKELFTDRLKAVFVLVSSRNANTIACLAASEEVDAFIIKPYSFVSLRDKFLEVISSKSYVPEYLSVVETAKTLIREGKSEDALTQLAHAKAMDPAPAVVCYFEGAIKRTQGKHEEAQKYFEEGLAFNPTHYRCLMGLLETLISRKRFENAYAIAQTITQNYPLDPKLIPPLIRLAIATKKFDDILELYTVVDGLEEKEPVIVSYLSAGLLVCGKYYLEAGRQPEGMSAFMKAESVSGGKAQIMKEIVASLLGAGLEAEAAAVLDRSSNEVKNSPEVNAARLEKLHLSAPPSKVLQLAMDLVNKNIRHPRIFEIAILRSVELQQRDTYIRELVESAGNAFPDRREHFQKLASGGR